MVSQVAFNLPDGYCLIKLLPIAATLAVMGADTTGDGRERVGF